jgi:hypothetical protein
MTEKEIRLDTMDRFKNYLTEFRKNFSESAELSDLFVEVNLAIERFKNKL